MDRSDRTDSSAAARSDDRTSRPSRRGRRTPPLAPISFVLGLVLVVVVVVASVATRRLVQDQEQRLLDERADEVATLLGSTLQSEAGFLQTVSVVWSAAGPQQVPVFMSVVGGLVKQSGATVGVASVQAGSVTTLATVGPVVPANLFALLTRANQAKGLVGGVVSDGGRRWLVLASPVLGGQGQAAFVESRFSPTTPIRRSSQSPFRELRGALYASKGPDPSQLVFTTDRTLPIQGHVVARPVTVGADRWYLVAATREPLAGSLAGRLHWIMLAGGLLAAALALVVAETLARRRRYAEQVVALRTGELRERENTLDALFAASPNALQIIDADGTIRMASPSVVEQLGGTAADIVGRSVAEFVHPDDLPFVSDAFRRVRDGEAERATIEYRARGADGRRVILDSQLARLPGDDGHQASVVAGTRDVTERSRLLQDLQLARTAAEDANRSKNEFLSRMSHELRTPLNAILGFAQLLDLETTSAAERETAAQIMKAGLHLLDLINEVLDISRIEAGHLALSVEPVRLDEVISEVLALTRSMAAERAIHLPTDPTPTCAQHVRADRQRLKQVLLNLIANAIKYNRDHGQVRITCERHPDDRVRVSVTDTGSGIEPAHLGRLFTPFDRLGAEQSGVEGTGLGLALSKRLIESMAGSIGVDSTPGAGSTFWIELALTDAPELPEPSLHGAPLAVGGDGAKRTVLYVEDNLSNVQLVERILEHRPQVELLVAMQGQLGLELARQHRPDLVLIDLNLPDIDGETVLRRLRAEPRTRDIPVVVISADATDGQIGRLRSAGASDYLTKPFDLPHFLRVIDGDHAEQPPDASADGHPGPPGTASAEAELDLDTLDDLKDSISADGLSSIVELYSHEGRVQLGALRTAVETDDAGGVRRITHQLYGSSASLGITSLLPTLSRLEALVDGADHLPARDEVHVLLTELDQRFEAAVDALHRTIDSASR